MCYDYLNRPIKEYIADGCYKSYEYDGAGRLLSVTEGLDSYNQEYNPANHRKTQYQYDSYKSHLGTYVIWGRTFFGTI